MATTPTTFPEITDALEPLALPHLLAGRYELRHLVGTGGMGHVYNSVDVMLHRVVAVKLLRRGPGVDAHDVARFHAEACALAAVESPYVVTIHDFGYAEDGLYVVMRHVRGHPLDQLLADCGALAVTRATRIVCDVLSGLEAIHERGLVHGDVKPGNVLIDDTCRAVLIDLGVAADLRAGRGVGGGTPPYMAPEVACGAVNHRADLFAVGLMLVEALIGQPVGSVDECAAHATSLPAPLATVVSCATDRDPARRFRDARAMRDALRGGTRSLRRRGLAHDAVLTTDRIPTEPRLTLRSRTTRPGPRGAS